MGWPCPAARLPHSCLLTLAPTAGWETEEEKQKRENLFNWWRKEKRKTTSNQSLSPTSRTASLQVLATLEAKKLLLLPLPLFSLLSMTLYGMQYPFGQFRSAVLVVSPPNFVPNACLLSGSQSGKQPWWLSKHCSAIAKTLVYYWHCFSHKSKTQHHIGCCEET